MLTADDIRFRKFTPVRFREGYDPDEVDDFLDEVTQTIEELTRIARTNALSTGTFAAVNTGITPSLSSINNSPIVTDLNERNASLMKEVAELKTELDQAKFALNNMQSGQQAQNNVASNGMSAEQLLSDNQSMAVKLLDVETQLNNYKSRIDALNSVPADNSQSEKIRELNIKLAEKDQELQKLVVALQSVKDDLAKSNEQLKVVTEKLTSQQAGVDTGSFAAISAAGTSVNGETASSITSMIEMATKLHDEYITKGKQEAENIVQNAKNDADKTYSNLAQQRNEIEKKIEGLREFEKDYRKKIKEFLSEIMSKVETK